MSSTSTDPRSASSSGHLGLPIDAENPFSFNAWGVPVLRASADGTPSDRTPELHRLAKSGELIRIRPGVFVPNKPWADAYPGERHRVTALGIALTSRQERVFCRETALLLHGFPLAWVPLDVRLRSTCSGDSRRKEFPTPVHAKWPVPHEQRIAVPQKWRALPAPVHAARHVINGRHLVAEDLRHCLADTMPRLSTVDAVIVADAVLSGLRNTTDRKIARLADPWTPDDLLVLGDLALTKKAAVRLQWLAGFASPSSGSAGESFSRVRIHELGFEPPTLQHEIRDATGKRLGIVDFWWDELRLAGEFDGMTKYLGADSYSGRELDPVFREEKERSERIQEEGVRFVRWTWSDLVDPRRLEAKLSRVGVPRSRR